MRRVVVLGGRGFFGAAAAGQMRADGLRPLIASRRAGADLRVDVDSRASLKSALRQGDIVVDAAGPFQTRTTAVIEAALETGFDVIDLSDSLRYAERVAELRLRIEAAGIRILTSCSSISTVSSLALRLSGIKEPARLSLVLRPAIRATAHRATAASLLESVGRPIRVLRDRRLVERRGWREPRSFKWPAGGRIRAYLCESADALLLPPLCPSLKRVDFYVDARAPGLNLALALAARSEGVRRVIGALLPIGLVLCRLLGSAGGGILYEIEGSEGAVVSVGFLAPRDSYFVALAPAVLAARAMAQGRFSATGLVPPDRQVEAPELLAYLSRLGVDLVTTRHARKKP
ncbi:MAG TPA: saccharopine dehydrogenase NADP-binding domain-containing protein [Candidatus Polarisedimenticolia bacterium]|nr:saccharopine dehydrogenase NADP-binding domain-containing protein [Candidatus Polarisedimenticolia bacterium]